MLLYTLFENMHCYNMHIPRLIDLKCTVHDMIMRIINGAWQIAIHLERGLRRLLCCVTHPLRPFTNLYTNSK